MAARSIRIGTGLVCPGLLAVVSEIVGIGDLAPLRLLRLVETIGDAVPLGIGNGFFLGVEEKLDLAFGVAGRGIAHQRLHLARRFRFELQKP